MSPGVPASGEGTTLWEPAQEVWEHILRDRARKYLGLIRRELHKYAATWFAQQHIDGFWKRWTWKRAFQKCRGAASENWKGVPSSWRQTEGYRGDGKELLPPPAQIAMEMERGGMRGRNFLFRRRKNVKGGLKLLNIWHLSWGLKSDWELARQTAKEMACWHAEKPWSPISEWAEGPET